MKILILGHKLQYEIQNVTAAFHPGQKLETVYEKQPDWDVLTYLRAGRQNSYLLLLVKTESGILRYHRRVPNSGERYKQRCETAFGQMLYTAYSSLTGVVPKWGILTGVRPVKNLQQHMAAGCDEPALRQLFCGDYRVSPEKFDLAYQTAIVQKQVLSPVDLRDVSLYVSIPFCPSRCLYCSFVSHSIEKSHKLVEPYLQLLLQEIALTFDLIDKLGLHLKTVYIGGGTPTTLSAQQMDRLLAAIFARIHHPLEECTVEAGRPDTIDLEKLQVMRRWPVTRVNINPQTLSDQVLQNIGRRHSAAQTIESFHLARQAGFDNINMDLIAGLPGDRYQGFCATLDRVLDLDPENITVHTLSVKRSADLKYSQMVRYSAQDLPVEAMLTYTVERLVGESGYRPYYMYRQKNTLSNLENAGYAKPGTEGLYNIYMMEELHTTIGCGAGSVTKMVDPRKNLIQRSFNFKYPLEYTKNFSEICSRKHSLEVFYGDLFQV